VDIIVLERLREITEGGNPLPIRPAVSMIWPAATLQISHTQDQRVAHPAALNPSPTRYPSFRRFYFRRSAVHCGS
jgi:hypothetical protein